MRDDSGFQPGFPDAGPGILHRLREGHHRSTRKACIREAVNGRLVDSPPVGAWSWVAETATHSDTRVSIPGTQGVLSAGESMAGEIVRLAF